MPSPVTEFAPAKVNLTLQVVGRRPDGYHELASLVAFADAGDSLAFAAGKAAGFALAGPFADALAGDDDNLVEKALALAAEAGFGLPAGQVTLTKTLPVAAGLGGGSADAAAALRLAARLAAEPPASARLHDLARRLGADVPVCLTPRAAFMTGFGERVSLCPPLPQTPAVLVNPGVEVATGAVFAALDAPALADDAGATAAPPGPFADVTALAACLKGLTNDLEAPALGLAPEIGEVLFVLGKAQDCLLARMSGSGATCFGLFPAMDAARAAADAISVAHPAWWVRATQLS